MTELTKKEVLEAHLGGKIGVGLLRKMESQRDLSIAYTPCVAKACEAIMKRPDDVYKYTSKGNNVAVVTDGTAVLGLGDIGAKASIPVMEGKAALFRRFGNVNAWPVPLENVRTNGMAGRTDVNKAIEAIKAMACMYGGINLEDFAAPECFLLEERLEKELGIPVFHDDQWGTAIIVSAAVRNYCALSGKKIDDIEVTINGAGAAGIRIADMLKGAGAEKIIIVDSRGVIHTGRKDLNKYKKKHAAESMKRTLTDAMKGSDIFIGVSRAGCVKPAMVKSMSDYPAIFAMANPVPEIMPEAVKGAMGNRPYVMATGRSDYPNQINNVLGFPYIFRGALDAKATRISMGMKIAAAKALAALARAGEVTKEVKKAYVRDFEFGPDYIIPVPFDPRLLERVGGAVRKAALKEGLSRK